jgi:hypothetical protein
MASPRERDHRGEISRARTYAHQIALPPVPRPGRRHHFHDAPPWPHRHHHDYIRVDDRWGWWPRWYPYSDPGWYQYWWQLYDYYGGDASPEYAEYARDAILRQRAPELGLVVSGGDTQGMGSYGGGYYGSGHAGGSYYGGTQVGRHTPPVEQRPHYQHPHYHYGDYVTFNGTWWPRWYPYSDPSWYQYWWQLYHYYGGDAHRDYAEYARDALLRTQMRTR